MAATLDFSNPIFANYAFYAAIVTIKVLFMSVLTAARRIGSNTFANPEDCASTGKKDLKPKFDNDNVERARRNHLNDIENVPFFLVLGVLYTLTGPTASVALWHFRVFVFSRILHTLAYQIPIPQPSRALTFFAGMGVNLSMAVQIIMYLK